MVYAKASIVCLTLSFIFISTHGSPVQQREQHPAQAEGQSTPQPLAVGTKGEQQPTERNKENPVITVKELTSSESPPLDPRKTPENITEKDDKLVTEILLKYGYFRQGKPLSQLLAESADDTAGRAERAVPSMEEARAEALRRFQSFVGLTPTGVVDKETLTVMKKGRCGVADMPEEAPHHMMADSQSPSDYSLLGPKWNQKKLTWQLEVPSNQLSHHKQRQTMEEAFAMWAEVIPLSFEQLRGAPRGQADIIIKFGTGPHGDRYPFDGKGKVLAHAFGPGEVDLSGDMHLDNDERWAVGADQDTNDLFLVAAHELGHSLGLSHSRDPAALMYPYYGFTDRLGEDDILAIQSVYGKHTGKPPKRRKRPTTTTTTTTTPKPVTHHWAKSATYFKGEFLPREETLGRCRIEFDAVFRDDYRQGHVYTGIQGDSVYRFNQEGVISGYPSTLNAVYPGAPQNADAIFGRPEKSATYFIKGHRVWRFTQSQLDPSYPKDLSPSHFHETIRFVLPVTDASGIQRLFVFGRTQWLEYNFDSLPSYTPSAYVISQYWPDVATDVKYAVTGYDGHIYFVSPHSHVILNSFRRAVHGGRKEGSPDWLQPVCHMSSGSSIPSATSASILTAWTLLLFFLLTKY